LSSKPWAGSVFLPPDVETANTLRLAIFPFRLPVVLFLLYFFERRGSRAARFAPYRVTAGSTHHSFSFFGRTFRWLSTAEYTEDADGEVFIPASIRIIRVIRSSISSFFVERPG
jgi:hypothetical protein